MTESPAVFEPGTLLAQVEQVERRALARSALKPIGTSLVYVEDGGIRFAIRLVSSLGDKEAARRLRQASKASGSEGTNPFLPGDPDLKVTALSSSHLCLLNKFKVLDHHLLLVTREYEEQEQLLNLEDFDALWRCLAECEGLGFYNGGRVGGASQAHKHLQFVPFPLVPEGPAVPVQALIDGLPSGWETGILEPWGFDHCLWSLPPGLAERPEVAAGLCLKRYTEMTDRLGLRPAEEADPVQAGPYNLLVTREWMLLVARTRESWGRISINSLGFAGLLLARDESEADFITRTGPLTILTAVGRPRR